MSVQDEVLQSQSMEYPSSDPLSPLRGTKEYFLLDLDADYGGRVARDAGGGNILSSWSIWLIGNYLQLVSLQCIPLKIIFFVNVKSHIKKTTTLITLLYASISSMSASE